MGTVSMSLQDDPRVKPSTREHVHKVAKLLNYRPLASARALSAGKSYMIGVVFASQFEKRVLLSAYSLALQCISDALTQRNYHLNLATRSELEDEEGDKRLPRMFHEIGVDGFLIVQTPGPKLSAAVQAQNVPYVVMDGESPSGGLSVIVDEVRAVEQAVEHLIALGHRRIANLTMIPQQTDQQDSPSHRREQFPRGYLRAMAQAGLPAIPGWDEPVHTLKHLEHLWQQPAPPTGLLAYDDQTALGVIKWLWQRGLSVPRDVSVVALHDIGFAHIDWLPLPSITCKANMQEQMASIAVEKLLHLIEQPQDLLEPVTLEPRLVVRESSGPCPDSQQDHL